MAYKGGNRASWCFSGFNTHELHQRPCLYALAAPRSPDRDFRSIGNPLDQYDNGF